MFTTVAQPKNAVRKPQVVRTPKAETSPRTPKTRRSFTAILLRALATFAV